MTAAFVIAFLAVIALAYVAEPVLRRDEEGAPVDPEPSEAAARKRAALIGILDLEDERAAGKLSDKDFADLTGAYEAEAAEALRELDSLPPLDDDIEREIASIRARLVCRRCGAPRVGDGACPSCGDA